MNQLIFKRLVLLFVLGLWLTNIHAAINNIVEIDLGYLAKKEFTKSFKEEFDIASNGEVGLHNRYGKIDVKTWDQNKVKVDVTITVNAKNEQTANEVFERIDIDFTNGSDYVKVETSIESKKSGWGGWWSSSNKSDYTINYEVYMPATCELDLSNKYGDSYVDALDNNANVVVKYGNIRMEGVKNDLNLDIGYGNGTVVSAGDTEVLIKYGRINLKEAKDVDMESKYSKINIDKAGDLKSVSKYDVYDIGRIRDFKNQGKYDHIEIEHVENVIAYSKYTDFYIEELTKSADFDLSYGGAKVESIKSGFSEIRIDGSYADFKLYMDAGADYSLDAVTKYAGIHYPSNLDVHIDKEHGSSHEVKGYKGGENAKGSIKARLNYGGLKIR